MAWLYVPGLEASNSVFPWQCLDIELYVTLNGKQVLRPFSWRGWKTRRWNRLLSGTILDPSTAARGVESWISSLRAIHVNRSRSPESNSVPSTPVICGQILLVSSTRSTPQSSSWKTFQDIYDSDLSRSGMTFKQWVTRLRQVCLQRRKSALRTKESDCSSWPTCKASDADKGGPNHCAGDGSPYLTALAARWPSPTSSAAVQGQNVPDGRRGQTLIGAARGQMWPTSTGRDWKDGSPTERTKEKGLLGRVAGNWPTPKTPTGGPENRASKSKRGSGGGDLDSASRSFRPDPTTTQRGQKSSKSGRTSLPQLNPAFVEWLMGFPEGWTGSGLSETAFCRWKQLMRSALCGLLQGGID